MTDGYIYCFSNPSMPGIIKVGMTERTPEVRLSEANASNTWRPPTPYKIDFAKKVSDASGKEKTLHTLLEQYKDRINPRREFFRVSPEEVRKFFDLMDGEIWTGTCVEENKETKNVLTFEQIKQMAIKEALKAEGLLRHRCRKGGARHKATPYIIEQMMKDCKIPLGTEISQCMAPKKAPSYMMTFILKWDENDGSYYAEEKSWTDNNSTTTEIKSPTRFNSLYLSEVVNHLRKSYNKWVETTKPVGADGKSLAHCQSTGSLKGYSAYTLIKASTGSKWLNEYDDFKVWMSKNCRVDKKFKIEVKRETEAESESTPEAED
jgi:hypothetical protein